MKHQPNGAFAASALNRFVARLTRHLPLDEDEQQELLNLPGEVTQFRAGTDVVHQFPGGRRASLVVEGIVARFEETEEGKRQASALFVPGDMCDLHRIVCPQSSWNLTAFTSCSVLFISLDELHQAIDRYPAIGRVFWRDLAIDACLAAKWIGNVALRNGPSRVSHLICELGLRLEASGLSSRTSFILEVTQDRLAEAVGLTPVHLNRVLQQLRKDGLLSPRARGISVKDWDGLCARAGFDPTYLQFPSGHKVVDGFQYQSLIDAVAS